MSEFDSALKNAIPESLMLSANARARRGQQDAAERAAAEEEKKSSARRSEAGQNLLLTALAGLAEATRNRNTEPQYTPSEQAAIDARNAFTENKAAWSDAREEEKARKNEEDSNRSPEEMWLVGDPSYMDAGYGPTDITFIDELMPSVKGVSNLSNLSNKTRDQNTRTMENSLRNSPLDDVVKQQQYYKAANETARQAADETDADFGSGSKSGSGSKPRSGSSQSSGSEDLTPEKSREENDNMFANDEVTTTENIWQPKEAQSDLAVAWYDSLGGDDEAMSNHLASSSLVYDEYRQLASTMPGYADSGFGQYDNLLDFQMYGSADEWLEWTKFANETQGYYKDLEGVDGYIDPDKFYEFYDMCKREYEISQILGQNGALSPEEINMYSYLLLTDYQTCQAAAQYLIDSAAASGLDISSYLQANGVADQDTLARLLYLNSNSYGAIDKGADSYNEAYRLMAEEDDAAGLNPRQVEVGAYRPYAEGGVYTGNRRTPEALWSADTENRGGIGKAANEKGSELWNELNLDPNTGDEIKIADRNYLDKLLAANQYQLGYGSRYV